MRKIKLLVKIFFFMTKDIENTIVYSYAGGSVCLNFYINKKKVEQVWY